MPSKLKQEIYKKKLYISKLINLDNCNYLVIDFAMNYLIDL